MSNPPGHLHFAFILFPLAQPLDLLGPLDVLNSLKPGYHGKDPSPKITITSTIVASTLDAVNLNGGLKILPDMTFEEAQKRNWEGVMVPGGLGVRPRYETNVPAMEFLRVLVPKCTYVLTVSTLFSPGIIY